MHKFTIILLIISLIGRINVLKSQTLHTPAQILDIMEQSDLNYTVDSLATFTHERPNKILTRKELSFLLAKDRELPLGAAPRGLSSLRNGECIKATKMLVRKSNNFENLSLEDQLDLCDCLHKEGDWSSSVPILLKLQSQYPRHFEIARKLSMAYRQTDRLALAYDQIVRAWIYNRNHTIIQDELFEMANTLGQPVNQWEWQPNVEITPDSNGARISFRPPNYWLSFGLCEALWGFEPGYASKMKLMANSESENIQATECLMNAIITYTHDQEIPSPAMDALNRAVVSKLTSAYIFFEINLPKDPAIALELDAAEFDEIVTYLKTCR